MSNIIPGYEYDIFISYRQKDNKGDGWVTRFVDALKTELEATFKEDISVYFDENPNDRLQEIHNVDKSLKEKLKCLIFLPILSKTYCDPNSYAWQYEFLAFLKLAENDQYGRDIRLRSGNVTSRILPIRIHDIENEDTKLFEKETASALRAMDFVFRTATGVNRPLKASEDHPLDNLNKTFYSDQINKVAIAIDEIIHSLKSKQTLAASKLADYNSKSYAQGEDEIKPDSRTKLIRKKSKTGLKVILAVILTLACVFGVIKIIASRKQAIHIANLEKSIAVLPFKNDSPDQENSYFINGLMEELLNNLQKINDFRILSRTSTEQYKGDAIPTIPEIAKKLNVNYIVEGSGQKYGNKFRLRVQLIDAQTEKQLWADSYEREMRESSEIFSLQSQIAQSIAAELEATITPEEKQIIEKVSTTNLSAYDFYLRGRDEHTKYWRDNTNFRALANAILYYKLALKSDSTFSQAYTGLAMARFNSYSSNVATKIIFSENDLKIVNDSIISLIDKALTYNNKLEEAYFVRGLCAVDDDMALKEYRKALEINPNYGFAYYGIASVFWRKGETIDCLKNIIKSIELERGPLLPVLLTELGQWYEGKGFNENAIDLYNQKFQLTNDTLQYFQDMAGPYFDSENWEESVIWAKKVLEKNPNHVWAHHHLATIYEFLGNDDLFYYHAERLTELGLYAHVAEYYKGWILWKHGDKIKADAIFDKVIDYSDKLDESRRNLGLNYLWLAEIYSVKGEQKKAMLYINKITSSLRERWFIIVMEKDPLLQNIRSDERFQKILVEAKSDWQNEHEKVRIWLKQNNLLKI